MCGFAGFVQRRSGIEEREANAAAMAGALRHRGPDDAGVWHDRVAGVTLAHRRLAVLDLTAEGHQPMVSADDRYVIAYNGEIYNHEELRRELSPHTWRGHSDTEVLLEALRRWGVEAALGRLAGMYAFALWDRHERTLYLARDRFGEKPLYYGLVGGVFLFGSELKALRAHPSWRAEVDRDALTAYLRYNCVPAPHTIYRGIRKLPPGAFLAIASDVSDIPMPRRYWSCIDAAIAAKSRPFSGNAQDAADQLETILLDAIGRQCVADVPLGAFLSGGIDSSLVVALMQAASSRAVRTFTVGFREWGYDEAPSAAAVARHLGTDHTELYVSADEAQSIIPSLPEFYDEPFADSSQIPTHLVARLARQHVKVSLSGDGGDEIFGGYNRYSWAARVGKIRHAAPSWLRRAVAGTLEYVAPDRWDALFRMLPRSMTPSTPGDKIHKMATALRCDTSQALYMQLVSQWPNPGAIVIDGHEPANPALPVFSRSGLTVAEQMMLADADGYLADDILAKVDRATMSVSLESRAPYLDHRVFEFAWRIPLAMKIHDGQGKWLLRHVLYRHVPRTLVERPKMGFGVPIASWLRGPLRTWAEDLLDVTQLKRGGWFDPAPIRRAWEEHLSGARNWQHRLWTILMFQAWLARWH